MPVKFQLLLLLIGSRVAWAAEPASAPSPPTMTFTLTPANGLIYAQIWKDRGTVAQGLSHDHVLRATEWQGQVRFDVRAISQCQVRFSVVVNGLRSDDPELRKRVGLPGELSESQRRSVEEHLREPNQLNAAAFPTITFVASGCRGRGASFGTIDVDGVLKIAGKEKKVSLPMRFEVNAGALAAEGSLVVEHSDFGIKPYSALLGAVKNGEDIKISIALGKFSD